MSRARATEWAVVIALLAVMIPMSGGCWKAVLSFAVVGLAIGWLMSAAR